MDQNNQNKAITPQSVEYVDKSQKSVDNENLFPEIRDSTRIDEQALIRKIDLRLLPILFVIYVVAFLDR
ncbi:High-affinity nicotinic acid transporter [Clarireedia jacksonii]